jgi:two-component system sensor kinase FixL
MEFPIQERSHILDSFFQAAVDCMLIIDKRGVIRLSNDMTHTMFGYSAAELMGKNISMLMPSPHKERHDQYLKTYMDTGEARIIGKGREEYGLRKDGSLFPMKLAVSRIELHGEVYFAGIIHDTTQLKAAQAEIEAMNRELEEKVRLRTKELEEKNAILSREIRERKEIEAQLRSNELNLKNALEKEKELSELKSRFVSMASHEFRTPLSTILSSAGLISRYPETEQQVQRQRHIDRIKTSVSMLTGILQDFLSLAKVEEGRITLKPEAFELDELIHEIVEELKHQIRPGQTITYHASQGRVVLQQDRALLKNALYNLLSNASKYSPEDKLILIRSAQKGGDILLEIVDQGIGIPDHDQQHMFTRFFRAKNAINIQGTGLGLNIVRHYTQLLGGEVQFVSREGEGSTFTLTIPIRHP